MENEKEVCNKCEQTKFDERGVALDHGLVTYLCVNCHEHSASYIKGQRHLCHACARKLGVCVFCGKPIN